ncbi:MAG: hypothetical protein ACYTCU_10950, partial [Planctomycetota bacterium]
EYGKSFKNFFAHLGKNKDLDIENRSYSNVIGAMKIPSLISVVESLEKRLGKSIEELEDEWREWTAQSYGELNAQAYYLAARLALRHPQDDGSHVDIAFENFQKAVDLGIENGECYRAYAELLRKGGVLEGNAAYVQRKPDPVLAWEIIQKAIDISPLNALNYTEAAGILILDGPVQDLDKAADLAATATAIAGSRNYSVKSLVDELMALIEPAREKARIRAELQAELDASDLRNWMVMPFYYEGDPVPDRIEDLTTQDIRDLIAAGTIKGEDHVYQTWFQTDPETGDPIPGENAWDTTWVKLKDVPVFAEDLAAAAGAGTR